MSYMGRSPLGSYNLGLLPPVPCAQAAIIPQTTTRASSLGPVPLGPPNAVARAALQLPLLSPDKLNIKINNDGAGL